jgi:hypothetical protein
MLMQREVYLGRGRKAGSIRERSRKRERTDWNESRHRSHGNILLDREESTGRVKAATESKPGSGKQSRQGNGLKDMKLAEKCWAYADARRGILTSRRENKRDWNNFGGQDGILI